MPRAVTLYAFVMCPEGQAVAAIPVLSCLWVERSASLIPIMPASSPGKFSEGFMSNTARATDTDRWARQLKHSNSIPVITT